MSGAASPECMTGAIACTLQPRQGCFELVVAGHRHIAGEVDHLGNLEEEALLGNPGPAEAVLVDPIVNCQHMIMRR
jgi:hypothetical protein